MSVVVEVGKSAVGGWNWNAISAVATTAAVVVAMFVGLLPHFLEGRRRRSQAKVLAQFLVDQLSVQEVHLRAAMGAPFDEDGDVDCWVFSEVQILLSYLDPQPVVELMSFSPNLPRGVTDAMAQCAASLSFAVKRRGNCPEVKVGLSYNLEDDVPWFTQIADEIRDLRLVLCSWIGVEPQNFEDDIKRFSEQIVPAARSRELGWREEQKLRKSELEQQ